MATKTKRPRRSTRAVRGVETTELAVELSTVDEALSTYDGSFLDCRDLRHAWLRQGYWTEGGYVKRRLLCERCGTTRTDVWSFDGRDRYAGSYDYVDGYLLTGVDGHARPTDVRHEIITRATVFADEQDMLASLARRRSNGTVNHSTGKKR